MYTKLHILFLGLLYGFAGYGQLYFPNVTYYNNEIERLSFDSDYTESYYNSHLSLKPILDKRTIPDSLYKSNGKHYYWITQKIFKENFIIFKGEDYWCSIDPILDLELGTDFSADSTEKLYWNTRGIKIQGKFFNQVGFTSICLKKRIPTPFYPILNFKMSEEEVDLEVTGIHA